MIPMLMAGSAALGMGGSIFGGLFGASAARKQAERMRQAGDQSIGMINTSVTQANEKAAAFNETARGDLAPFRQFGVDAGNTLTSLLFGGGDVTNTLKASPLFNFQSELGSRNINRELAARGLYGSGAGLETLARFNDQLVGEEGQRLTDRLFGLTQLGQGAATNMASITSNTGNSMADRIFSGGVTAANTFYNSRVGAAQQQANATNILGQMGSNLFSQAGQGVMQYGNFMMNKPIIDSSMRMNNAIASKYGMVSPEDSALAMKHGISQ